MIDPARLGKLRRYLPPRLWGKAGVAATVLEQQLRGGGLGSLGRNEALRDRYRGRRGFLIGNGASLKGVPLHRLGDEVVITVNTFFDHAQGLGVRPTAHVFYDAWYFEQGLDDLRRYAEHPAALTFLPLQYQKALAPILPDAHHFFPAGAFEDNHNLDLCRPVPHFQTVALPALLVALHLGLDPIYLVGCDMDFLRHVVDVSPLRVAVPYFYDDGPPKISEPAFDYQGYVEAIARMFAGYRFVRDHLPPGRSVYNAGVGGALDLFERVPFDSLFAA